MVDAQALITKETVTTEDRSNFDKMILDADVLGADITRMQSVEKFKAEQRNSSESETSLYSVDAYRPGQP